MTDGRDAQFRHVAQRACYWHVAEIVDSAFPDQVTADPERPCFIVARGSTAVHVTVYALGEDAVVHMRAQVVRGGHRDEQLLDLLLRQNAKLVYGTFAIDAQGDIVFTHATPAVAVTRESLQRQLATMLDVADHFDDFIQGQWGGARAIDEV
jgi:hypothetical protein